MTGNSNLGVNPIYPQIHTDGSKEFDKLSRQNIRNKNMENNVKVLTHSGTGYTLNKQRCESNYNSGNPNLRNGQLRHPSTF